MICRRNYKTYKGYSVLWFSSIGVDEFGHAKFFNCNENAKYVNIINKKKYNPLNILPAVNTYNKTIIDKGSYIINENPSIPNISNEAFSVKVIGSTLSSQDTYGDNVEYTYLFLTGDYVAFTNGEIGDTITYYGTWEYSGGLTTTDTTRLRTIEIKNDLYVPEEVKYWWDNNTTPLEGVKFDVGYVDGDTIYVWCNLGDVFDFHTLDEIREYCEGNDYTLTIISNARELSSYFANINTHNNYVGEQQGVVDSLIQRLSVIKGELWYNPTYGLPLTDKIRSKGLMDAAVADIIYNQPDVELINSFTSDIGKSHIYNFDFSVITIYTPDSVRARLEVGS